MRYWILYKSEASVWGRVDEQVMPYKGLEVQFLMEQIIVLDEVIEGSAAAQRC